MVHDTAALKAMADRCWEIYKARNDSVITDLFAGMYKSTVVCPTCDKVSIIFDPFNNLTLQLPIASVWSKKIIVFPLRSKPVVVDVDIDKNASFLALKEFVAVRVGIDPKQTMVAELYKHGIYKLFQDTATIREENIVDSDTVGIWEFEGRPTNFPTKKKPQRSFHYSSSNDDEEIPDDDSPVADRMLVPVFHRRLKGGPKIYRSNSLFAAPSFIVVNREEAKDHDAILRKVLARAATMTTRDFLREEAGTEEDTAEDSDTVLLNSDETSETQAKSLESEDGMIDISMRDGDKEPGSSSDTQTRPLVEPNRKPIAPMLRANSFITPGVRSLFEMKVVPSSRTMIPTGINYISEERKDYATLASRIPEASPRPKISAREQIAQRQSNMAESPITSDEDADDVLPTFQAQHQLGDDSDDDGLPPVEQILQPSTGFSKFNRSTPRNKKGLITYSRQGKYNRAAATKIQASMQASRDVTPAESGPLLHLGESLVLDWMPDAYDALFLGIEGRDEDDCMRGVATWENPPTLPDAELDEKRRIRNSRRRNGITLGDCLDEFGKPEILSQDDAWYCPRCKEHRRASKTFEIWKAPDILVVHLKRFSSQARMRDKLDVLVDFPVEGLDLTTKLAIQDDEKSPIYDLFAVDNHYGGLGGGHYTAYAQNYIDKSWYEYNGMLKQKSPCGGNDTDKIRLGCITTFRPQSCCNISCISLILPPPLICPFRGPFL
jgi:ubiquitin carboxyl-terminal hydrolase 4/11/15